MNPDVARENRELHTLRAQVARHTDEIVDALGQMGCDHADLLDAVSDIKALLAINTNPPLDLIESRLDRLVAKVNHRARVYAERRANPILTTGGAS